MVKMIDMGMKEKKGDAPVEAKSETRISYPGFSLEGDKIPEELKDAKLEQMCRLEIVVKKMGDGIATYTEGKPRRVEVEIHQLGYLADAGKKSFKEYDKMSDEEKEEYDRESVETEE